MQAVELANVLRARMGTEALAIVREAHGGLLSLLEKHNTVFKVDRIPKNDCVSLPASDEELAALDLEDIRADASGDGSGAGGRGVDSGIVPESWSSSLAIPSRCLHVGNVAITMTEEKLRHQFGAFGKIESMK